MIELLAQKKVAFLIVIIVTILAYSNIFQNGFVLDDISFITEWTQIRSLDSIPDLLMGDVPPVHQGVYRPIRSLFYLLYYHLFGTNPFWWHLQSLIVHLSSTVLVYLIVEQLLKNYELGIRNHGNRERKNHNSYFMIPYSNLVAFATSLLFGLHPIHTESITYIAASMEMTGVIFFFSAFLFYLRFRSGENQKNSSQESIKYHVSSIKRKQKYILPNIYYLLLSYCFAIGAFFTYEMTLTLPLLLFLYEITVGRKLETRDWKLDLVSSFKLLVSKQILPYFLIAFFYVLVRVILIGTISRGEYLAYSFYHTMLTMVKVFVVYIQLLLFPFNISYLHELAPGFYSWMTPYDKLQSILNQSLFDPEILLGLLGIFGLLTAAIFLRKKLPLISFCILWFFISLLPVSYIFPQGIALAEKYLYIPSFGFILLEVLLMVQVVTYLVTKVQSLKFKVQNNSPRGEAGNSKSKTFNFKLQFLTFHFVLLIIAGVYFYLTFTRNFDWRDAEHFWLATHKQHLKSPLATYTLGVTYSTKKDIDKAEVYYLKTIELEPTFWQAHFNLGNTYAIQGRLELAKQEYVIVLNLVPDFSPARKNLENMSKTQSNK